MDIQIIAQNYPELLEHMLSRATGQLGEYLVSEALRKRGFETEFTKNAAELDLHVTASDGRTFTVEVKAGRHRAPWFVRKRPHNADFWVFVHAPKGDTFVPTNPSFWVFTLAEVQTLWDANPYNVKNPTAGDIRAHQMTPDALDAWHKVGV